MYVHTYMPPALQACAMNSFTEKCAFETDYRCILFFPGLDGMPLPPPQHWLSSAGQLDNTSDY